MCFDSTRETNSNKVMKANEAPEKIYFSQTENGRQYFTSAIPFEREFVEYIRIDAFIEKAVRFLKEWDAYRVCLEGHKDWFIEQFKNYMK